VLLLDVDGVLCPVANNTQPNLYHAPSPDFRSATYEHPDTGEAIQLWVSSENGQRAKRLAAAFEIVWATGWGAHANRFIAPLHGLTDLGFVNLAWSEDLRAMDASWKLPAIAQHVGEDRPCVWIDDDLRPDVQKWARDRPGPTLLVPVDHRVGLTDSAVVCALKFASTL
jgi:HAD domain in Swiss Army Knife RNA repair proteins